MEWIKNTGKIPEILGKYKYAIIVLILGILLMMIPKQITQQEDQKFAENQPVTEQTISKELTKILEQIQGVGKVQLMLTLDCGEETLYQYDESENYGDQGSIRKETVIITDASRNQSGLIRKIQHASYRGAVIVCEGGDQPAVCFSVVQAVSRVTGLSTDKISVLKMK